MRRGGHRDRTDISGSKVPGAPNYTRPQVHRWIRTIPDGFADHSYHQILRTKMDSVRVERTPADFQSAATTESAYCPFCRITPTVEKQDTKNSMIKSHGAIGWNCCMCPIARWIGFEPITSAFGKQFLKLLLKSRAGFVFLRALPLELPPVMNAVLLNRKCRQSMITPTGFEPVSPH